MNRGGGPDVAGPQVSRRDPLEGHAGMRAVSFHGGGIIRLETFLPRHTQALAIISEIEYAQLFEARAHGGVDALIDEAAVRNRRGATGGCRLGAIKPELPGAVGGI